MEADPPPDSPFLVELKHPDNVLRQAHQHRNRHLWDSFQRYFNALRRNFLSFSSAMKDTAIAFEEYWHSMRDIFSDADSMDAQPEDENEAKAEHHMTRLRSRFESKPWRVVIHDKTWLGQSFGTLEATQGLLDELFPERSLRFVMYCTDFQVRETPFLPCASKRVGAYRSILPCIEHGDDTYLLLQAFHDASDPLRVLCTIRDNQSIQPPSIFSLNTDTTQGPEEARVVAWKIPNSINVLSGIAVVCIDCDEIRADTCLSLESTPLERNPLFSIKHVPLKRKAHPTVVSPKPVINRVTSPTQDMHGD